MTRVRTLRTFVAGLLVVFALVAIVGTVWLGFPATLGAGVTLLFSVLALMIAELDRWFGRTEAAAREREAEDALRVKLLADRARADVLGQVRRTWVRPALSGLLSQEAPFRLHLAARPGAVAHPLADLLGSPIRRTEDVVRVESIGDAFDEVGRQLLILGEPGAGKTTLLMELTEQLVIEAEQNPGAPVPIVFHLAAWSADGRTLSRWFVAELHKRYGVPQRLGERWVEEDQVIPLLDGLDEVSDRSREACVVAINQWHDGHGMQPVVVTSRTAEYENLSSALRLRGAVEVEPLSREEVDRYLELAGSKLGALRTVMRDDMELATLLTAPLFLAMAVKIYSGRTPRSERTTGLVELRRAMVGDFVETMFSRSLPLASQLYKTSETSRWLRWLATTMRSNGESLFYFDWIQPSWLPNSDQTRLPSLGAAAIAAIPAGVVAGGVAVALTLDRAWQVQAIAVAIVALPLALLVGALSFKRSIEPSDALRWSRAAVRENVSRWTLIGSVLFGLVFGLAGGTLFGLLAASKFSPGKALVFGLEAGIVFAIPASMMFGLLLLLASGLQPSAYVARPGPGIAILRSRRNGLVSAGVASLAVAIALGSVIWLVIWLASGLLVGLGRGVFFAPTDLVVYGALGPFKYRFVVGLIAGIAAGLPVGLLVGLVVGFQRGAGAYFRHVLTRWLLVADGVAPRAYLAFLEYACRLGLLRRRGGGYEFIHSLVLDHFATPSGDANRNAPTR